jgi:hypothetical protein
MSITTAEVFAAMKEAVTGVGGKALQGKFKVGRQCCGIVWHPIRLLFVVASHITGAATHHSKGTVTFTVGEEVYSLDLSSPSSRNVSKGDAFNGNADLHVTCSPEIMMKMIAKEVQPQQGEWIDINSV